MNLALVFAALLALAVGALAFAFLGGDDAAAKRRQAVARPSSRKAAAVVADRAQKKKQIAESLADLDKRAKTRRADLQTRIEQAGLSMSKVNFLAIFAVLALVAGALLYLKFQNPYIAGLVALTVGIGLPNLALARMRTRRIKKFIDALPAALDIIVRGVRAGLPVNDTLRIIANEASEPVRSEFRRVVEQQSLGISVPEALQKLAHRVPATETNFFAIVIEIQSKAGGNLSEAISNLSKTVRDRKKMKAKIGAMSMEALASAAIIGAVPFLVSGALYVTSPKYMSLLFTTSHGRIVTLVGLCWMAIGGAMMKKMINFDF
jgi:tight adherence protein B